MGPLITQGIISPDWNSLLAFIIGIFFGIALEQGGLSSTRKMMGLFYGYDMVVLRVFLTAVVTAVVGLSYFHYLGWMDFDLVYINPTFVWSLVIGGAMVGIGFVVGGYCPGTGFAAASIGKIDAIAFIGGITLGVFFYAETFELIFQDLYNAAALGKLRIYDSLGISQGLFVLLLAIIAVVIFYFTPKIQKKFSNKELKY